MRRNPYGFIHYTNGPDPFRTFSALAWWLAVLWIGGLALVSTVRWWRAEGVYLMPPLSGPGPQYQVAPPPEDLSTNMIQVHTVESALGTTLPGPTPKRVPEEGAPTP